MTNYEGVRNPVSDQVGKKALEICLEEINKNNIPDNLDLKSAVKFTLQLLHKKIPGKSVELRIPPFAAVSIIEGKDHKRGTPPATIEIEAITWLKLASGLLNWSEALKAGLIYASGPDTDLTTHLPIHKNKTNE